MKSIASTIALGIFLVAALIGVSRLQAEVADGDEPQRAAPLAPALSPDEIARLIAEHQGIERKVESGKGMVLDLAGLASLDAATAQQLARYPGKELRLDGLETLTVEAARELAGFARELAGSAAEIGTILSLNGLTSLSDEAAQKLGGFWGRELQLNGLTTISPRAAENLLSRNEFTLELEGLTTLDANVARILARPPAAAEFADDDRLRGDRTWPLSTWSGKLPRLTVLSTDAAKELQSYKGVLALNGLTSLDAATAKMLAGASSPALDLDGLQDLDVETAAALARMKPSVLRLNGLRTLPAATARALARFRGQTLHLNGLERVDLDAARALATLKNNFIPWQSSTTDLGLSGLAALDAATASALAKFKGKSLNLNGLAFVDPETAQALAAFSGERLLLVGLKTLDPAAARALAKFKGQHLYVGLASLSPAAAGPLANFKGTFLSLSGHETLDAGIATALAPFQGELFLNDLTALDAAAARELAAANASFLHLNGLTTLTPDAAEALAGFPRGVCFRNLKHLTAAAARLQVQAPQDKFSFNYGLNSKFSFNSGLNSSVSVLDPEAARVMAKYASQVLGNNSFGYGGLTTLSPDVARELAKFSGGSLDLNGVTVIDADTARALVGFHKDGCGAPDRRQCARASQQCPHCTASISLEGLTTLSAEVAAILGQFKGDTLRLGNTRNVPAAAMGPILAFEGSMLDMPSVTTVDFNTRPPTRAWQPPQDMPSITSLDLDTATTLVASARWDGQLPDITALDSPDSVAIAQALAKRKGRLALPNLEKISPKTLTALLKKKDVQLPLIETLKLIPEPDGSPTED